MAFVSNEGSAKFPEWLWTYTEALVCIGGVVFGVGWVYLVIAQKLLSFCGNESMLFDVYIKFNFLNI